MDKAQSGTDLQLLCAPSADAEIAVRALTQEPVAARSGDPGYTCSLCGSSWPYQAVRNTGRCPACGSGLLRDTARL